MAGTVVRIAAAKGASEKTRERIREHGGRFFSGDGSRRTIGFFRGKMVQHFESVAAHGPEWQGWLPLDEFSVVRLCDVPHCEVSDSCEWCPMGQE